MLLVTFHGGPTGINNVHAYDKHGKHVTEAALEGPKHGKLSELRAMVLANSLLYVANGAKSESTVLAYKVPKSSPPSSNSPFKYAATLIKPTLSHNGHFETSIAHPFGIAFKDDEKTCFISNQDTNVVSLVSVSADGSSGTLGKGCQSPYLDKLYPTGTFLDGTYVASQVGTLPHVSVAATAVAAGNGGLGVSFDDSGKVKNSVRGVAIANGILFVCDEPGKVVNFYALTDGRHLGSSTALSASPTHLSIAAGGLYVSAGPALYWARLPPNPPPASLALQAISVTPPEAGDKIGGIAFNDDTSKIYIPFQKGTGGDNPGGSIYSYSLSQPSPSQVPTLSNAVALVSSLQDTPEFLLHWSAGS
jgi:hypothetical protein